jgi:hypothetical protein
MKNMKFNVGSFATAKLQAKMRSILAIIALVAVIGFSMTACDDERHYDDKGGSKEANTGRLLLTDIPQKYNGGYIKLPLLKSAEGLRLVGFQKYDGTTTTYVKISNGKADMPIWIQDGYSIKEYYGSDTVTAVNHPNGEIYIHKEATNQEANYTELGRGFFSNDTIVFVNGFAEKSLKDVWWYIDNVD